MALLRVKTNRSIDKVVGMGNTKNIDAFQRKKEIRQKRAKVARARRALLLLTPVWGVGAIVTFALSLSTHDWEVFNSPVSHLNLCFSVAICRNC